MTIKTTCIGAFPKPDYISVTNWSESGEQIDGDSAARQFNYAKLASMPDTSDLFDRATQDAIADQVACGKVVPDGDHFLDRDFKFAQECTDRPVKMTVPGPITIMDTTADAFYENDRQLAFDLDDEDYQKADPDSYLRLARSLNDSCVDQISIEDAHRHPDCGLIMLERDLAMKKLANLSAAARATS
ncbi:MAG: hypothetical protein IIA12_07010 [Proteobacteria bacterium]|nr:hypothetical protein [Pseudomonadota bacterium]